MEVRTHIQIMLRVNCNLFSDHLISLNVKFPMLNLDLLLYSGDAGVGGQ